MSNKNIFIAALAFTILFWIARSADFSWNFAVALVINYYGFKAIRYCYRQFLATF